MKDWSHFRINKCCDAGNVNSSSDTGSKPNTDVKALSHILRAGKSFAQTCGGISKVIHLHITLKSVGWEQHKLTSSQGD